MSRTATVRVPVHFDSNSFKDFLNEFLPAFKAHDKILLDFGKCKFPDVDALLLLQMFDDISKESGKTIEYLPDGDSKEPGILEKMRRLFQPGYSSLSPESFEEYFSDRIMQISRSWKMDDVRLVVNKMDKIIQHQLKATKEIAMALSWCMGEITDNCVTHGYENYDRKDLNLPVYTSVWGLDNLVEIVIADRGQGIVQSLKKKKKYEAMVKSEVIRESIKKGVSGHPEFSPGFGLYGVSEITKRTNGKMTIISNGVRLNINGGEVSTSALLNFPGTFISVEVNKNAPISLVDILGPASMDNLDFLLELE